MFTKARWDKSFIFNSIRLRREWLPLPGRLGKTAPAAFTVHIVGRDGQPQELTGALPLDQETLAYHARWATILTTLGYSAFVPALRQNTSFRSGGSRAESTRTGMSQLPEELLLR